MFLTLAPPDDQCTLRIKPCLRHLNALHCEIWPHASGRVFRIYFYIALAAGAANDTSIETHSSIPPCGDRGVIRGQP
jgi:hypothetical protein